MKEYYVYMMTNKMNTVLYIGVTNNLIRRVFEHKQKLADGFTKKYNADQLVYYEIFDDPKNAIKKEKTLKNLVRRKKNALISKINPRWEDLYKEILSSR